MTLLFTLTGQAEYGLSNIQHQRLKVSRFSACNDPFELSLISERDRAIRKPAREERARINETWGLICFSSTYQSPVMWGHYGDSHRGISLGFELDESLVKPAIYTNERVHLRKAGQLYGELYDEVMVKRLLLSKFEDWRYENEFRMVVPLTGHVPDERGLLFLSFAGRLDIALKHVILGANCKVPLTRVREAVCALQLPHEVDVWKARLAFKSFDIVRKGGWKKPIP